MPFISVVKCMKGYNATVQFCEVEVCQIAKQF